MTDKREEAVVEQKLVCPFLPPMMGRNAVGQQTLNYMTCLGEQCQLWYPAEKRCSMGKPKPPLPLT